MAENPTIVVSENPNICQQPVAVAQEIVFDLENRKVGIAAAQCVQLRDLQIGLGQTWINKPARHFTGK